MNLTRRTQLWWPTALLMLMALLAYSYWMPRTHFVNVDSHLALTRAIVDDHTLQIDRYAAGLDDRARYHGHYYTDKAPGLSFLVVPAYAVLRAILDPTYFAPQRFYVVQYLVTLVVIGIPAAVFVGLLWHFLLPILGRRRSALLAIAYAFGTMAWPFSVLLFSHMVAAMALFGAFMLLLPISLPASSELRRPLVWWRWAGAGMLSGLAVLCEYPAALIALPLGIFAVHTARMWGIRGMAAALLTFSATALAMLLPLALYNRVVYGDFFTQGYAHLAGGTQYIAGMRHGLEGVSRPDPAVLWAIMFSVRRGIFVLSPFLLLAMPGVFAMWRRRRYRPATAVCAFVAVVMALFNSSYYFWDGGNSLGPRHFTPAVPFMIVLVAFAWRSPRWRRVGAALVGPAILAVTIGTTVLVFAVLYPADAQVLSPFAPAAPDSAPLSIGTLMGLHGMAAVLPLAVAEALLGLALYRSVRIQRAVSSPRSQFSSRHAPQSPAGERLGASDPV